MLKNIDWRWNRSKSQFQNQIIKYSIFVRKPELYLWPNRFMYTPDSEYYCRVHYKMMSCAWSDIWEKLLLLVWGKIIIIAANNFSSYISGNPCDSALTIFSFGITCSTSTTNTVLLILYLYWSSSNSIPFHFSIYLFPKFSDHYLYQLLSKVDITAFEPSRFVDLDVRRRESF